MTGRPSPRLRFRAWRLLGNFGPCPAIDILALAASPEDRDLCHGFPPAVGTLLYAAVAAPSASRFHGAQRYKLAETLTSTAAAVLGRF